MERRPAWKQPQALVLIAGGGVLALATLYLLVSTWGAPAPSAAPLPPRFADENALVAANAERKGGEAISNESSGIISSPPAGERPSGSKPDTERFNPNEIVADAQRSLDEAGDQVDQVQQEVQADDDKPADPEGPR